MNITELIEKVREIDEESADYLEGDAKKLPGYKDEGDCSIMSVLTWDWSPQGFGHWAAISDLLDE